MKGSGKVLSGIAIVTCMMLFYVHLQVSSVIVSFELNKTNQNYATKQELLRRLQFNVEQLKAPRFLEERMKKHDLALGLPNRIQVVEVPNVAKLEFPMEQDLSKIPSVTSGLTKFFGRLIQTAQAKTDT